MQLSTIGTTVLDIFGWGIYTCYITTSGLDVFRTDDGTKVAYCYVTNPKAGAGNENGIYIATSSGIYFIPKDQVSGNCNETLLYNSVQLLSSLVYDIEVLGQKMLIGTASGINYIPNLLEGDVIYSCPGTNIQECVMNDTRIVCFRPNNYVYIGEHPTNDWTLDQMKQPGNWANSPGAPIRLPQDTSLYPTGQERFRIRHLKDDYFVCWALDDPLDDHYWSNAFAIILYRAVRGTVFEIQRFNHEVPVLYQHRHILPISDDSFFLATGSDSHISHLVQLVNGRLELTQYTGPGNTIHGPVTPISGTSKLINTGDEDGYGPKAWIIDNVDDIPTITQDTWMSFDGHDKRADFADGQYILGRSAGHLYPGYWGGSSYVAEPILIDWDDDKASTVQAMFVYNGIAYIQHTGDLYFTMYDMTVNNLVDTIVGTLPYPTGVDTFRDYGSNLLQVNNYEYFVGVNETTWDLYVCKLETDGLSFTVLYQLSPRTDPGRGPNSVAIGEKYVMAFYDSQEDMLVWEIAPDTWNTMVYADYGGYVIDIDIGEELFLAVDNVGVMCIDISDLEGDLLPHTIPVPYQNNITAISVTSDATRTEGLIGYSTLYNSGIFKPTDP